MDNTLENRELVVACLCEFCKQTDWRQLLRNAHKALDKSKTDRAILRRLPNESTVYRLVKGDTQAKDMRETIFKQLVWLLKYHNALDGYKEEKPSFSLHEKSINLSLALKQFINPTLSSNQHLADKLVGQYQGYRWSIVVNKKKLDLFRLVIEYDNENDVMISRETIYNPINGKQEVLEGAVVINLNYKNRNYIISRSEIEAIGLQFTSFHYHSVDGNEQVSQISGAVYGQLAQLPFIRSVFFERHDSPEINLITPDQEKHGPIINVLLHMEHYQRKESSSFIEKLI